MLEKWKKAADKGDHFGALLTDLSKAFDCLSHELLVAKLNAYGFSLPSVRLIHDYLSNRKQRTGANSTFSSWLEIIFGVPQGSILGPLLFNIFLCDMFLIISDTDFASYADDNTPYTTAETIDSVLASLDKASKALFQWFSNNEMKANPNKSRLLLGSKETTVMTVDNTLVESSQSERLLGINLDTNLSFILHLEEMCKKASQKLNAIARIIPVMSVEKKKNTRKCFL